MKQRKKISIALKTALAVAALATGTACDDPAEHDTPSALKAQIENLGGVVSRREAQIAGLESIIRRQTNFLWVYGGVIGFLCIALWRSETRRSHGAPQASVLPPPAKPRAKTIIIDATSIGGAGSKFSIMPSVTIALELIKQGNPPRVVYGEIVTKWLIREHNTAELHTLKSIAAAVPGVFVVKTGGVSRLQPNKDAVLLTNSDLVATQWFDTGAIVQKVYANGEHLRAAILGSKPIPVLELSAALAILGIKLPPSQPLPAKVHRNGHVKLERVTT